MNFRDEVVGIELVPFDGEVFNLTVDEDNSYALEGIITHNCLCGKKAVTQSPDAFAGRLRDWMQGTSRDPQLDAYAKMLGQSGAGFANVSFSDLLSSSANAIALSEWLWGNVKTLDQRVEA